MQRLTFEGNFCDIVMCQEQRYGEYCKYGACSQRKVWERLKEYEDTGFTPNDIKESLLKAKTLDDVYKMSLVKE
jgi:hypothetical protein